MDWSPPCSSVHGLSQARILERVAISFSMGSLGTRDWIHFSCIGRRILYHWATKEVQRSLRNWLHCLEILHLWTEFTQVFFLSLFAMNKQCLSCVNETAYSSVWKWWDPGSHRHAVSVFSELHLLRPHHQNLEGPQCHRKKDLVATGCARHQAGGIYALIHYSEYLILKRWKRHISCPWGVCKEGLYSQLTIWKQIRKKLNWHVNSMLGE